MKEARLSIVVSPDTKDVFQTTAKRNGKDLSTWVRDSLGLVSRTPDDVLQKVNDLNALNEISERTGDSEYVLLLVRKGA